MNALKGLKGFKGLTTVGLLLSAIFVLIVSVFYIIPAIAENQLSSGAVVPSTVSNGQKLPSLNFSVSLSGNGNVTQVKVNFSVFGANTAGNFTVPTSNDSVVCGGRTANLAGWLSRINATSVTCYNATTDANPNGPYGTFNISIVNLTVGTYVPTATGTYTFNISTIANDTSSNTNSTTVTVTVQRIAGRATTNVTAAEIGKNQSISFTITNPSESDRDIDKIVINFSSAGFVAPTGVSCPGIGNGGNGWGAATVGANDVTCAKGSGGVLGIGASTTIILNGTQAGQTPGIQPFYVGLYDTTLGEWANFTNSTTVAVYGLLNITGTNTAPGTVVLNKNSTDNITQFIRFNFSTRGEGMNITSITILRTGTAADADVLTVQIYNSTPAADSDVDPFANATNATTVQLIATNTTPDSLGRYTFTNFRWNISGSSDSVDQYLYVVAKITREATGGRTLGFMINNTGNVTSTSAITNQAITESLVTGASNNATIVGNITITGTDVAPAAITVGATNVSIIVFNFAPSGEQMNVTNLTITRTGTATDADIVAVGLYNSSSDGSNVYTANATLIAWNTTPDSLGRYDFNNTNFNVSTSGNRLLVVVNISSTAVATRTVGFLLNGTGNVTVRSAVSNQLLTETLVTTSSINATLGNLTITGTSTAPSLIFINKNGTDNGTQFVRFNFSTRGEGANITSITILRTGTAQNADVLEVALYNSTPAADSDTDPLTNVQLIGKNTSAPDSLGRYNFSGFRWNISGSSDSVDQYLYVVANVSRGATADRTIGFMINNTDNVTVSGAVSARTVSEFLVTGASNNATIVGNITITGTSDAPGGILGAASNVSTIRFTFDADGEQMNVTQIVLTRTGNAQDADIPAVAIYNSSSDGSNVFTANATLIAWNTSAPDSLGRYTFAVGLNVSATTNNIVLVVYNSSSSAVAARTVGFMINGTGNVTTTSGVTNQAITETLVTTSSANTTIAGNITITGTSQIAATVTVGSRNLTFISYNFSALGEGMNVTGINLTLTGTVSTADIESVGIYNGTNTTFNVDFLTEIARNSSAPRADGTYSFSNIKFNVTASDRDGNVLLVVVNFTAGSATSGNKTIGFKLNPAANASITGAVSGIAITPIMATTSSANATIVGNLTVSTTADISANVKINQKRVAFLNLTFMARGEQVNITNINLTLRGNASFANVSEVRLFNDDGSANGTLDGSDTLIAGTVTIPSSSRLAITPTSVIALNASIAKVIFVVFNISDESDAGAVAGVQINSTDVAALTNTTAQALSTSWAAVVTANRTIQSNIGQQAVGGVTGWYTLNVPSQTIMESIGRTAGTTQSFNISKIFYSLRTNYRFVYYNTDGTTSGWKLFDRTDWAGSSLQYANNTNDKVYWVNMTAEDTFEL